jgi:hypothetical protein
MPALDGTGPLGMGRMTGRRLGYCNNIIVRPSGVWHLIWIIPSITCYIYYMMKKQDHEKRR